MYRRIAANLFVLAIASIAFLTLAAVNGSRSDETRIELSSAVAELWGQPQVQMAPSLVLRWTTTEDRVEIRTDAEGQSRSVTTTVTVPHLLDLAPERTRVATSLDLDRRSKGLLRFDLYGLRFDGTWTFRHHEAEPRDCEFVFPFTTSDGIYDDFHFEIDGVDVAAQTAPVDGVVRWATRLEPGRDVVLRVRFNSRGMGSWTYRPSATVARLEDFELQLQTDFPEIDFPAGSISPSSRAKEGEGEVLRWDFERIVTGSTVGVVVPESIQPGALAQELSGSAPVSLALFLFWVAMLAVLRSLPIHTMHLLLVAGAFFAFNLLFSYTADRLAPWAAFALSSAVSVGLVVSYLRLVVGARHAFLEFGLAQLLYQVGFAAAHFLDGYTGLTITVLGILTLFLVMQLTGRVKWEEVTSRPAVGPASP